MLDLMMIICTCFLVTEYVITRRFINVFTVFVIPYMFIIPFNNLIMVRYGFYSISNEVICMILMGFVSIFAGTFMANLRAGILRKRVRYVQSDKFKYYYMDKMLKYAVFVEILTIIRFLYVVLSYGFAYIASSSYEGYLVRGIAGHLLLTIYPLIPILFYYWLRHKEEKRYLLTAIIAVGLLFLTFVKYHSIGMVVLLYLFVSLEDHTYLKKGAIMMGLIAIAFFVTNYVLSFAIRGTVLQVSKVYYINHLWNYIAGSLIYDNQIFQNELHPGYGILYKIASFTVPVINLFLNKLFNVRLFPFLGNEFAAVGSNGERGNVIDAIGYLFPAERRWINYYFFAATLFIIGFTFTLIYNRALREREHFRITISVFMTFFMFFSFFGTFYVNLIPWEVLIWSILLPPFFDRRIHIKWKQ